MIMRGKKAESGISTLIIFIAMLLVAAIAAGVLIQTTSSLQNKALVTGKHSRDQISTHVEILSVVGQDGSDGDVEQVSVIVKLSPGSESIEFNDTIITVDTSTNYDTLSFAGAAATGAYSVEYLENGTSHKQNYLVRGDVAEITMILPNPLEEDETFRLDIIPKVGVQTSLEVSMPDIMTSLREHLYP